MRAQTSASCAGMSGGGRARVRARTSAALPIDNEKLRRVAARGSALSERGKFAILQTYRRVAAYSHAEWVGSCALAERKASRWRKELIVEAIEILEAQQV